MWATCFLRWWFNPEQFHLCHYILNSWKTHPEKTHTHTHTHAMHVWLQVVYNRFASCGTCWLLVETWFCYTCCLLHVISRIFMHIMAHSSSSISKGFRRYLVNLLITPPKPNMDTQKWCFGRAQSGFKFGQTASNMVIFGTPPKTNVATEKWLLDDEFPVWNGPLSGDMSIFWGVSILNFCCASLHIYVILHHIVTSLESSPDDPLRWFSHPASGGSKKITLEVQPGSTRFEPTEEHPKLKTLI